MNFKEIDLNTHTFCMSINRKRYEYLCKNFNAVGLSSPVLFRGGRWNRGSNTGCVLAHLSILAMCRTQKYPYCIIFEDDAYPRPDVIEMWEKIRETIPDDCGLLKLGNSSYRGDVKHINQYIDIMLNGAAFGSHAYFIRQEMYDKVIDFMSIENVPESFLNYENFKDYSFKPYVLNFDSELFIQKNISMDNIISNKGGQRYWFPSKENKCGCTSPNPCEHFVDRLIPDEDDYVERISIIYCDRFKKKKKTGCVREKDNILYTKDESALLKKIKDGIFEIKWHDSNITNEYLKFDDEINGVAHYHIVRNLI